jgi:hypothetical protein
MRNHIYAIGLMIGIFLFFFGFSWMALYMTKFVIGALVFAAGVCLYNACFLLIQMWRD